MDYACIFPGQGSQSVGMLSELAGEHAIVQQTFEQASDVIGLDLWKLVSEGPEGKLGQTENTQPALLAASIACWRVLNSQMDVKPCVMAGHSFGEYSALVAGGALSFEKGVALARRRGVIMQSAVAEGVGAMAAVLGLEDQRIIDLCAQVSSSDQVVDAVNFNSPGQVVIAGHKPAVEAAIEEAKANGAKRALLLPVSVPAHSRLMQAAAEEFRPYVEEAELTAPQPGVLHNADLEMHSDTNSMVDVLCRQLYSPVRWTETIEKMQGMGAELFLEVGPGKVLCGLNKRINKSLQCICVSDPQTLAQAMEAIN